MIIARRKEMDSKGDRMDDEATGKRFLTECSDLGFWELGFAFFRSLDLALG